MIGKYLSKKGLLKDDEDDEDDGKVNNTSSSTKKTSKQSTLISKNKGKSDKEDEDDEDDYEMDDDDDNMEEEDDDLDDDDDDEAEEDDNDDDDDDDESDDDGLIPIVIDQNEKKKRNRSKPNEMVNISFQFCDPDGDNDYALVRALILHGTFGPLAASAQSLCSDASMNLISSLSDQICTQKCVGCMIKGDDEASTGEIYSFGTVLTAIKSFRSPVVGYLMQYLNSQLKKKKKSSQDKSKSEDSEENFDILEFYDSHKCGLFVTERMVNVPPQLSPPLHQVLQEDLDWVNKEYEEAMVPKGIFDFEYIIMASPCFMKSDSASSSEGSSQKSKKQKSSSSASSSSQADTKSIPSEVDFVYFEDSIFSEAAFKQFLIPLNYASITGSSSKGSEFEHRAFKPTHAVIQIIPNNKMKKCIEKAQKRVV